MKIIASVTLHFSYEKLYSLCLAGTVVFRLNFSHIQPTEENEVLLEEFSEKIRKLKEENFAVEVAVDNRGPEIRTGKEIVCRKNDEVIFTGENLSTDQFSRPTSNELLIDDGQYRFSLIDFSTSKIITRAQGNYEIAGGKSLNIFKEDRLSYLNDADEKIFKWAIRFGFKIFFLSFVRNSDDMKNIQKYFLPHDVILIAKIEIKKAVDQLDKILSYCDGYMIARGDLFMNLGYEQSYQVYKQLLQYSTEKIKLTATGYATSLLLNSQLSQPEIVDISLATEKKCDGLLLSNETIFAPEPENIISQVRQVIRFSSGYYKEDKDEKIMRNTPKESFSKDSKQPVIEKYTFRKILRRNTVFYK